jgi:hypothetical protein
MYLDLMGKSHTDVGGKRQDVIIILQDVPSLRSGISVISTVFRNRIYDIMLPGA